VGTADKVHRQIKTGLDKRHVDYEFDVVSNPEFLKEGAAVNDCKRPDRIVIGTTSARAEDTMRDLYAPFNRNHDKVILMGVRSAELTKYAANCMLATKISFMNEMANLAERLGADIEEVRLGIGSDSRIGYSFIYPGAGYGGSCFPKDVQALIRTAKSLGYPGRILDAVERVNGDQKRRLLDLIDQHYTDPGTEDLATKTFAVWGLSFKPQTDDVREATSRVVMEGLWKRGARVQAYDPEAMEEIQRIYGSRDDLRLCGTKEAALEGADALIICTEWKHFWAPDFDQLHDKLGDRAIFDGRNIYDPQKIKELGFDYYGIGRGLSVSRDGGL
jgi:UDPglucose 6-dehydrogenase